MKQNDANTTVTTTQPSTIKFNHRDNNSNTSIITNETECLLINHKSNVYHIDSQTFVPRNSYFPFSKKSNKNPTDNNNNANQNDDDDDNEHNTVIECSAESLRLLEQIEEKANLRRQQVSVNSNN